MSCVKPLQAYLSAWNINSSQKGVVTPFSDGKKGGKPYRHVSFKEIDGYNSIKLPCGQCVGCRLERSRQWAMRCMHEAQLHTENCFITLTYDDTHLPSDRSLAYPDFQKFIKRLRKYLGNTKIRYYMAGEYGENFGRPHFHACIFGYDFHDKKLWKRTTAGSKLYRSSDLEKLWPYGYSSVGDVNFESAAYVARYIMKKITGKKSDDHYTEINQDTGEIVKRVPEFNKMSLKPGIGAEWYKKFKSDVYPHDYVVVRGKKMKPPKAYDKMYKKSNPYEYDELLYTREKNAKLNPDNSDPKRLDAKRQILESKLSLLKRNLT